MWEWFVGFGIVLKCSSSWFWEFDWCLESNCGLGFEEGSAPARGSYSWLWWNFKTGSFLAVCSASEVSKVQVPLLVVAEVTLGIQNEARTSRFKFGKVKYQSPAYLR
ncbi:hypothetical protein Droror1_Dr00001618 [Drosera rotundifolia]